MQFHANGKFLLSGEYFVLDGALALALPLRRGQTLTLSGSAGETLHWVSLDEEGEPWFEGVFQTDNFECLHSSDAKVAERLQKVLREARNLSEGFLVPSTQEATTALPPNKFGGYRVNTHLDFPRPWGLGTSSTLIYNVAKWSGADPFALQFRSFGGSGYDVACAGTDQPLLYRLRDGRPFWESCEFAPTFSKCLYFIYLGKKQDSRAGIAQYRSGQSGRQATVEQVSALTMEFLRAKTLAEFEALLSEHERIVGEAIGLQRAKDIYFQDYWGEVKSLGAWGGDFVLATSERPVEETRRYFLHKGCPVFFAYDELALNIKTTHS